MKRHGTFVFLLLTNIQTAQSPTQSVQVWFQFCEKFWLLLLNQN